MTNFKSTKRALLASVLSTMLCVVMLIGATFAWFTDSVTSGKNKIVAGNLDVELEYSVDGTNWADVNENTNMFKKEARWEPGYTEVVYLRVKNVGNLALKYQFGINVASKVIGKTADDKDIDLSNFIKFGVVEAAAAYVDRTAARDAVKDNAVLVSAGYSSAEGHLTAGSKSAMLALVAYMPEEVGNEANHGTGKTAPEINMGINLVATQDTVESDSFDNQYDKDAGYPSIKVSTVEEFKNAIKPGETITISNDIDLAAAGYNSNNPFVIDADNVTVDLNGNNIDTLNVGFKVTGENITIKNGTIRRPIGRTYSYGLKLNGVNTTIENVTIYSGINVSGYNPDDSVKPGVSAKIVNCSIYLDCEWAYYAVCAQGEAAVTVEDVVITRTDAGKANYHFWVEKEFTDELGYVGNSSIILNNVTMNSTCNTTLYNPSGLEPENLTIDDTDIEDPFA